MKVPLKLAAEFVGAAGFRTMGLEGAWPEGARSWLLGNLAAEVRVLPVPGMPLPDVTVGWLEELGEPEKLGEREGDEKTLLMKPVELRM